MIVTRHGSNVVWQHMLSLRGDGAFWDIPPPATRFRDRVAFRRHRPLGLTRVGAGFEEGVGVAYPSERVKYGVDNRRIWPCWRSPSAFVMVQGARLAR